MRFPPACGPTRASDDFSTVVTSPDGRYAYAVGGARTGGGIAVLRVDQARHSLLERQCVTFDGADGDCVDADGIGSAESAAMAPDGRHLYVGGAEEIATFAREPESGRLRQTACLAAVGRGRCAAVPGLEGTAVAVSPDGRNVYGVGFETPTLTVMTREPRSGGLTRTGCLNAGGVGGCRRARGLHRTGSVVVTPDGRHVYVAGISGELTAYRRSAGGGGLRQIDCAGRPGHPAGPGCGAIAGLDDTDAVAVSPDGRHLYVSSGGSSGGGLLILRRSPRTGRLSTIRCLQDRVYGRERGCRRVNGLAGASAIAVSGDGRRVYVGSSAAFVAEDGVRGFDPNAVAAFERNRRTGSLRPLGCVGQQHRPACSEDRALFGLEALAPLPRGGGLLVVSEQSVTHLAPGVDTHRSAQLRHEGRAIRLRLRCPAQPRRACRGIVRLESAVGRTFRRTRVRGRRRFRGRAGRSLSLTVRLRPPAGPRERLLLASAGMTVPGGRRLTTRRVVDLR